MDVNSTVSKNLRRLREARKLSLDSTARLTGVSKSMLGQIERGEVNPTISVLWKIASGLKTSFTSLVERPIDDTLIIRGGETDTLTEDGGRYITHPVFPFDEKKGFETLRLEILTGGSLEATPHLPGSEEYVTVFAGSVELTVGADVYHLARYDSLRFKADVPHFYKNAGQTPAELSMIIWYAR